MSADEPREPRPAENELPPADNRDDADGAAGGDELEALRELLVGEERRRIGDVEARVDRRQLDAGEVARVLPDAVARGARQDGRLSRALAPTIEGAIESSVRRNPRPLTDAIFPLMGPAIRKSIRASLASMLEGFNQALESSLTPRGLRWRLEARRTGRPFSEVVLLHSLVFRVEQVFLVHSETGLLLEHVVAPSIPHQDPDMVSAMLTAINDFARESFDPGERTGLQQVEISGLTVLVAQGPRAYVAAVVRGTAPRAYRERLEETVENIHLELGDALAGFDGDSAPFAAAALPLEGCLEEQRREASRGPRWRSPGTVAVAVVALFVTWLGVSSLVTSSSHRRDLSGARTKLEQEPGIFLLSAERRDGRYRLRGLRDPLAREVDAVLAETLIDRDEVDADFEPYTSLVPEFLHRRALAALEPPSTVLVTVQEGTLHATGQAPNAWIRKARLLGPTIGGIERVDLSELVDVDWLEMLAVRERLQRTVVPFDPGSADVDLEGAGLLALRGELHQLAAVARRCGQVVEVQLVGRALRDEPAPQALAQRRAVAVRAALLDEPLPSLSLTTDARASQEPPAGIPTERWRGSAGSVHVILRLPEQ